MSVPVIDRAGIPVLGKASRAEELVEWSIEKVSPGTRFVRALPCGLTLHFVANHNEPKMYIHWNPAKFTEFMKVVGQQERFFCITHGICVEEFLGEVRVRLLTAGKQRIVLWDTKGRKFCRAQATADFNCLVGMVRFSEAGPVFLEQVESQKELEEASALAIIDTSKKKVITVKTQTPTQKLITNKKTLLSKKSADMLLADAMLEIHLGKNREVSQQ